MKELPTYPAKVLLFGEYSVIDGSKALALPLFAKSGGWIENGTSSYDASPLVSYLKDTVEAGILDVKRMEMDLDSGVIFHSDIPEGYGLGSSGSVAAAILDRYGVEDTYSMQYARKVLIDIESFFHGRSSGLDPMVSYYRSPILCEGGGMRPIDFLDTENLIDGYVLVDSGRSRSTKTYVDLFKELKKDQAFLSLYYELYDLNNLIIEKILHQKDYRKELFQLSDIQFHIFDPMIPEPLKEVWAHGLSSGAYTMKLCGAGGGGCFLAYESVEGAVKEAFPSLSLICTKDNNLAQV